MPFPSPSSSAIMTPHDAMGVFNMPIYGRVREDKSANNNLGHAFVMFGLAVFWPCVLGNIAGIIISRIKIED